MSLLLLGAGKSAPGSSGPATEDVAVNAVASLGFFTIVDGAANSTAGAVTALSDGSDSTSVTGDEADFQVNGTGFADLVDHGGRGIASIQFIVRGISGSNTTATIDTFSGITPTPSSRTAAIGTAVVDQLTAAFTKNGGGNWSVAEINAMTCRLTAGYTSLTAVRKLTMRVTYA